MENYVVSINANNILWGGTCIDEANLQKETLEIHDCLASHELDPAELAETSLNAGTAK
jgi:hypothetical protein